MYLSMYPLKRGSILLQTSMCATLDRWCKEYNGDRPRSALAHRTPRKFAPAIACGNVESEERFSLSHKHDYGCWMHSQPNQARETPANGRGPFTKRLPLRMA